MGTFFVIPVYLQVVLGLDAFETGKRLLPLSVAMLVFALLGPADRRPALAAHRRAGRAGRGQHRRDRDARDARRDAQRHRLQGRARPDRRGRRPARLAARQRDHVLGRARRRPARRGGLQGTAQNLGSSLGTAIIGAVLLASLATGFSQRIADNPDDPGGRARDDRREHRAGDRHRAGRHRREAAAVEGGLTPDQAAAPSPPTTATRSSTRCGSRSARSRSRRCCRCGSRGGCRRSRLPMLAPAPPSKRRRLPLRTVRAQTCSTAEMLDGSSAVRQWRDGREQRRTGSPGL